MKYTVNNLQELETVAHTFVSSLKPSSAATLVSLKGNLGAGKTTFTQMVAKIMGVEETVTSPTFVIEKIYKLKDKPYEHLIHIDAYRLESGKELETLGWHEMAVNPKNCIFIEWPEKVADLSLSFSYTISFEFINETTQEIEVE